MLCVVFTWSKCVSSILPSLCALLTLRLTTPQSWVSMADPPSSCCSPHLTSPPSRLQKTIFSDTFRSHTVAKLALNNIFLRSGQILKLGLGLGV